MKFKPIYQENTLPVWLLAFELPTKHWVRPFLPEMGFPENLQSQLYFLSIIYRKLCQKVKEEWEIKLKNKYSPEADIEITKKVIDMGFKDIAVKIGSEEALQLKEWSYHNIVCKNISDGLFMWRIILRHACGKGNKTYHIVPPPEILLPLLPKIQKLVQFSVDKKISESIIQQHLFSDDYNNNSNLKIEHNPDIMVVEKIIRNQWTIKALKLITSEVSASQLCLISAWALSQANELCINTNKQFLQTLIEWINENNNC